MVDCFHGWRRKVGVVTLAMACPILGIWLKSFEWGYFLEVHRSPILHTFLTAHRGLAWVTEEEILKPPNALGHTLNWSGFPIGGEDLPWPEVTNGIQGRRSWSHCGFYIVEGYYINATGKRVVKKIGLVPYWFLIIPLTVLSASLILANPGTSTREKIGVPIREGVA